jgi:hypothetical protein
MRIKVWQPLLLVLLASCASASGGKGGQTAVNVFTITVVNNSRFDIELIDDTRVVPARAEKALTLPRYTGELDDGYSLAYRVRLLDGVYIKILRGENIVVSPDQKTLVVENAEFDADETFIALQNNSVHTVKLRSGTDYRAALEQAVDGRRQYGSANIAAGASALFDGIPPRAALYVESDSYRPAPFPPVAFKRGSLYAFAFDGESVTLIDARPLHAIGEPSEVQTLPALPEAVNQAVADGIPRSPAYRYRMINALSPRGDGLFLAAGEADEQGGFGREARAYICEVEAVGAGGGYTRWELGPGNLDPALGPARSAYFDSKRGVYRVLGELIEADDRGRRIPASYVIELDKAGKLTKPALAVRGAVLTKITGDEAGNFYLAGEAVEAGRSIALLVKYSGEGVEAWKAAALLPRNSYYQDALFDTDENQIALAGVEDGESGAGDGGVPFIRGISAETGDLVWHSELTAPPFRQTALAYRIEKTASGYRVVLCGVSGGSPVPPYIEASVNVRGRFIE